MREPDGEGQGPSAGLEFGPSGHQEGQEREAKAALSPHDPACPGAGLNGSLGSVSGTPGVADAAGNDLAAGPARPRAEHLHFRAPLAALARLSRERSIQPQKYFQKTFLSSLSYRTRCLPLCIMVIKHS